MVKIDGNQKILTLINTFYVKEENQAQLTELLNEATDKVMKFQRGFISANIHRSQDGKTVANYAQWESLEAFQAMQKNPEAREHMKRAADLCERFEPCLYTSITTHESAQVSLGM